MSDSETTQARARTVLIVDDEWNMRLTLADILAEEGYQITTAATGEEAVELCEKN